MMLFVRDKEGLVCGGKKERHCRKKSNLREGRVMGMNSFGQNRAEENVKRYQRRSLGRCRGLP